MMPHYFNYLTGRSVTTKSEVTTTEPLEELRARYIHMLDKPSKSWIAYLSPTEIASQFIIPNRLWPQVLKNSPKRVYFNCLTGKLVNRKSKSTVTLYMTPEQKQLSFSFSVSNKSWISRVSSKQISAEVIIPANLWNKALSINS